MDEQKELRQQFRNQQEKLTYYIIALCVAGIGFSVHSTSSDHLSWSHLPLGVAVLSWCISVFCGILFLKYVISTLYADIKCFEIFEGTDPEVGNHQQMIEAAIKGIKSAMKSNINKALRLSKWQSYLFYTGIIFFIIWHILRMYNN